MSPILAAELWRRRRFLLSGVALLVALLLGVVAVALVTVGAIPLAPPELQEQYRKVAAGLPLEVPYQELIAVDAVRLGQDWSRVTPKSIQETAALFYTCTGKGGGCRRHSLEEVLKGLKLSEVQQAHVRLMLASLTGSGGGDGCLGFAPNRSGALVWPVDGPLTACFGTRDNPTEPGTEEMHWGVDIGANEGTPIKAATSGRITFAGVAGGYGKLLILWSPEQGLVTWYGHLNGYAVHGSDQLEAGQVIGYVGSTGRSTGPHLHFETRPNGGSPVDPLSYYW